MASKPEVNVKQGTIVGGTDFLPNGNQYYFFKGIPYAEPPLGKLRFKAPIPLERFALPKIDCTKEGSMCFQRDKTGKYIGSEDCLFLNVYTPKIDSAEGLPVMVFIPGGAFITGNGNSENFNPLYLMQENVVVVTMNYRLGPLGFLSFPEGNIPGNAGLKDQRLVLEWVQENISKFGGDHNNVTLFGQSAGSVSTHIHVLSERSKKLFHKAILQSGTANMSFLIESNSPSKTIELAKSLGCESSDPIKVAEFLQCEDVEKIMEPAYRPLSSNYLQYGLAVPASPSIEEESPEAVFTKSADESLNVKNSIDIPIMMGFNTADGVVALSPFMEKLDSFTDNLHYFIPGYRENVEKFEELKSKMKALYFGQVKKDESMIGKVTDFMTDALFKMSILEVVELVSRMQHKSPLYCFSFDYEGGLNLHKIKYKMVNVIKGAAHCDELGYLFQSKHAPEPWNERDKEMVENICKMWTNFAKYGRPTLGSEWLPVKKVENKGDVSFDVYLFKDNGRMIKNPSKKEYDFWVDLKETASNLLKNS